MASKGQLKQITRALDAFGGAADPLEAMGAARRLREAAEAIEVAAVVAARAAGATWSQIGARYELTKQGAQQRFQRRM